YLYFRALTPLRHLHSFPTRRSSDLTLRARICLWVELSELIRLPEFKVCWPVDKGTSSIRVESLLFRAADFGSGRRQRTTNPVMADRKSTRLNSSHVSISYAVFCLKK